MKWKWKLSILLLGSLFAIAFISFPLLMKYKRQWIVDLIQDDFSKQNFLADVNWNNLDALPGYILLFTLLLFVYYWRTENNIRMFGSLLFGNILVIATASILLTGKIEQHTQGIAIDFFASKKNENCYIFHTGYKSYAPYFYSETKPFKYTDGLNLVNESYYRKTNKTTYLQLTESEKAELDDIQKEWLLHGNIDRTVYFIAKSDDREGLDQEHHLQELWDKNGFVVYKRAFNRH